MIPLIPKEIQGKIKFVHEDVQVKDGITLGEEEQRIFDKFRTGLISHHSRFDDEDDELNPFEG